MLLLTFVAAVLAALTEIEPALDAGVNTTRPVAALRPSTEAALDLTELEDVAIA